MTRFDEIRTDIITRIVASLIQNGTFRIQSDEGRNEMFRLAGLIADRILSSVSQTECAEPMALPLKNQLTKALDEVVALRQANSECSRMASVAKSKLNELEADVVQLVGNIGAQITNPALLPPVFEQFLSRHPHLKPQDQTPF